MLEKDFKDLLHNHRLLKSTNVVEASRLAVDPDMTDRRQKGRTSFLLYYLLYLWMRKNGMRYVYLVSTHKLIASLRRARGAPVTTFGRTAVTHDNVPYQAAFIDMHAIMDWRHRFLYSLQYLFI